MNTLSSLLKWIGNTIGANPNTLTTSSKTIVGAINEVRAAASTAQSTATTAQRTATEAWKVIYPVGSYYETSNSSFNPNVSWGGTWVKDSAGRVTVSQNTSDASFDAIGETGGAKTSATGNHTLTVNEIPSHRHSMSHTHNHAHGFLNNRVVPGLDSGTWARAKVAAGSSTSNLYLNVGNATASVYQVSYTDSDATNPSSSDTGYTGGGSAHNHGSVSTLQPYVVVIRWHRTA